MLQGTYFMLAESVPGKYRKTVLKILRTLFRWTHFTIQYVACKYMSSARCLVSCWQQHLQCEWNAKPQNCEADAQCTGQRFCTA